MKTPTPLTLLIAASTPFLTAAANPIDATNPNTANNFLLGNILVASLATAIIAALAYITYRLIKKWSAA